jgi:phosphatidylinositol alpha-mannosyltransferase
VGIVVPYDWNVRGGVQQHVRDFVDHVTHERLDGRPIEVSVLAPSSDPSDLPDYVTSAGKPTTVKANGSNARVALSPSAMAATRRWLSRGDFDLVHVHEPAVPLLGPVAAELSTAPVVATFHSASEQSKPMEVAAPVVRRALANLTARIAVSPAAEQTMARHLPGPVTIIPNGVEVKAFAEAPVNADWAGADRSTGTRPPTLAFVGRFDEPRKGLPTLLAALPEIARQHPGVRLLIAGKGDPAKVMAKVPNELREQVTFLGMVDDPAKASLLRSVDAFVAPNLGGESFGMILTEAMAAGTPVVASDLDAFRAVLDDGRVGVLFPTGDAGALADATSSLLKEPQRREQLRTDARAWVGQYDWSRVSSGVVAIWELVIDTTDHR